MQGDNLSQAPIIDLSSLIVFFSSAVLTDDINEPTSGLFDMRDQFGVPTAARYKTPTPDQIHMTGPIPDHIVSLTAGYRSTNNILFLDEDGQEL